MNSLPIAKLKIEIMKSQHATKMENLIFRQLTLLVLVVLFPLVSLAQGNKIVHLDELLTSNASKVTMKKEAPNSLGKLVSSKHDAIYLTKNIVKVYGNKPVVLYTDVASLGSLSTGNFDASNIKLILISITSTKDLMAQLDEKTLERFENLEFVYFKSDVTISPSDITKIVKGEFPKLTFIYKQEKDM